MYEIICINPLFRWGRIDGTFYCNKVHLKEFLIKYWKYKKNRAA